MSQLFYDQLFKTGSSLNFLHSHSEDYSKTLIGKTCGAYELSELLAEGGSGFIYRAKRTDGLFQREAAIKVFKLPVEQGRHEFFYNEVNALANLSHPTICTMYDAGFIEGEVPYLVMELLTGNNLQHHCRHSCTSELSKTILVSRLLSGLQYAHEKQIIHGDIKDANIIVNQDQRLKIVDFSLAISHQQKHSHQAYTPAIDAPEQIQKQWLSVATDIYQVGLLLLSVFSDWRLNRMSLHDVQEQDIADHIKDQLCLSYSASRATMAEIIQRCLMHNAKKRFSSIMELNISLQSLITCGGQAPPGALAG